MIDVNIVKGSLTKNDIIAQKIDEYYFHTRKYPHYIIMSRETVHMIKHPCAAPGGPHDATLISNVMGGVMEYHGVPIAMCDRVPFGEFEII